MGSSGHLDSDRGVKAKPLEWSGLQAESQDYRLLHFIKELAKSFCAIFKTTGKVYIYTYF